jgi:copper transport protein
VRAYARLAAWVFATVVVTGTVAALLLVPLPALTATGYGRLLLLAKLALVAAAAGLALAARRRLRRGPTADRPVTGLTRLEAGALVGVLAVTAALVSSPPPGGQQTQPAAPPPPAGVVLPLGTLAGQIGVGVAASERQLVVRLSAPSRGDYYATPGKQTFTLAGRLTAAGHRPTDLHWRGCGQGCFYTPASWRRGDNLLTLHASAPGWRGGTTSLVIPWPVQAASDQIGRVVAALRATDRFTLYEAVSSDTTSGPPDPQPLPMSGPFFLASEPYGSGVAPQAVVLPPPAAGQTRLALGFPADGRYVDLVIDDASARILDETVVDAKHLTRRHFVYHHDES